MKILGIIPARGGSKGVHKKNIQHLGPKPLIAYTIEAAQQATQLHAFIVSTDDEEIAKVAESAGADVPFIRPKGLATDSARAIPVLQHALTEMENRHQITYDAILMLQPTTPFRTSADIDQAVVLLKKNDADSVISVVDVQGHHPARMKYLEQGQLIDPDFCETYENQPRQELRPMYLRNGAIYLTRRETLLNNSLKGNKCMALIMDSARSVNIDTPADFSYAEYLLNQQL